jgi:hypothetical protein
LGALRAPNTITLHNYLIMNTHLSFCSFVEL